MYYLVSKKIRTYIISIFCFGLIVALSGCNNLDRKNDSYVSKTDFCFDTAIQIKIVHEDAEELLKESFALCHQLEKIFSKTDPDSELYKLNHRSSQEVIVSDELAEVIALGLEYSQKTEGIFDITICPVSDLWDFKSEDPVIPPKEDIQNAVKKVDYRNVHIDGNLVSFDSEETMLDLGAVAKGYAADYVKEYFVSKGVNSGFINFGGNVQTIGEKIDGSSWNVGIQKPFTDRGTLLDTVEVTDQSVVSAGVYERYFELDGKMYYHILDPRTGYPVKTDLNQMTIVCDESALGDILSTTCILMGEEKAKVFLEEVGFSNIWLHLEDQCAMIRQ